MLAAAILQLALAWGLHNDDKVPLQAESDGSHAWTEPRFAVDDVIDATEDQLRTYYAGIDLPTLDGEEQAYFRGNENIYRVKVETMIVIEVIPIGTVLIY